MWGGGTPKADAVRKLSKRGCVKMQTRGGGVKKSGNFTDVDVICTCPLTGLAAAEVQDYAQNRAEVRTATAAERFVEEIDVVVIPKTRADPFVKLFVGYLFLAQALDIDIVNVLLQCALQYPD